MVVSREGAMIWSYDMEPEDTKNNLKGERRYPSHSDRIIRGHDNKPRGSRFGGSRYGFGPYERKGVSTWREKPKTIAGPSSSPPVMEKNDNHGDGPYDQTSNALLISGNEDHQTQSRDEERSGGKYHKKRLASAIVSPSFERPSMEENVTIRNKRLARSLTYSPPTTEDGLESEQIIDALSGMELEHIDAGDMDCDVPEDDLLGEDLMELEGKAQPSIVAGSSSNNVAVQSSKRRSGSRLNAPLGVQSKKTEFLRRGSPRLRSVLSTKRHQHDEAERSRKRGQSHKKASDKTTKNEVLMDSKNPSKRH